MADAEKTEASAAAETADLSKAPYRAQDVNEVTELLRQMDAALRKDRNGAFGVKRTRFEVPDSRDGYTVDAWKINEWDYKKCNLPTYARGFFTTRGPQKGGRYERNGRPEIAVRGYDKFFNVTEVPETQWDFIEKNTQGPYELTLKENGCIIFVSGLADDTLLVCSKHSTGDRADVDLSHSAAGARHVERQLARLGRTKQELARELYSRNITAVAELCDDSFEEHILAYGPDKAGLYLHGINVNLPEFMTYPSRLVQAFAAQWGFRQVDLVLLEDIGQVRRFLEAAAETGSYDGRDVEGFVVRCRMSADPGLRPYGDWFFKYKFEEPYLMYRQWRECTKALIAGKPPRYKKHQQVTEEYLLFARRRLAANPQLAQLYQQNHGIIGLRDQFLAYKQMNGSEAAGLEGKTESSDASGLAGVSVDVKGDLVLVPIATIGCGKTTIAVALSQLLNFGHIQNDNITGARRPPRFTRMVLDELQTHPAVVADRNNAQRRERQQIIADVKAQSLTARLVALAFVHDDMQQVRAVTRKRVLARGDNHQTLHAAREPDKVLKVMDGFMQRFEPFDKGRMPDCGFDGVIELNPADGSRANVEKVVRELHRMYPSLVKEVPSAEAMDAAVQAALGGYRPLLRHDIPERPPQQQQQQARTPRAPANAPPRTATPKQRPLEYMSINVPADEVLAQLEKTLAGRPEDDAAFYRKLQKKERVQTSFHVTLMHRASAKNHPELWQRYVQLQTAAAAAAAALPKSDTAGRERALDLGHAGVQLERVVFDSRIMALVVRIVEGAEAGAETDGGAGGEEGWTCVNRVSHITIGTASHAVKPKESNTVLERWLDEGSTATNGIVDIGIEGRPVLPGVVRGVWGR